MKRSRVARPDSRDGVLAEPPPNLRQSVLLSLIESGGDFGVEGGGNRLRVEV